MLCFTWIIDLLKSFAENFEGSAELLSSEIGIEGEEDLDDFDGFVRVFCYCTHLV